MWVLEARGIVDLRFTGFHTLIYTMNGSWLHRRRNVVERASSPAIFHAFSERICVRHWISRIPKALSRIALSRFSLHFLAIFSATE